jgi:hypothetical protein
MRTVRDDPRFSVNKILSFGLEFSKKTDLAAENSKP